MVSGNGEPPAFLGVPQRLAYFDQAGYGDDKGKWVLHIAAASFTGVEITRFLTWLEDHTPPEIRPIALGGEIEEEPK